MENGLLNVRQVGELLGLSTRQIWKLSSIGQLPAPVRIARSVRWRASELHDWIAGGCPNRERWEALRKAVPLEA